VATATTRRRVLALAVGSLAALAAGRLAANALEVADRLVVRKGERRLYLMNGDRVLRSFRVALGLTPKGPKRREGDFRTPEGEYRVIGRNPNSDFFLALHVSYGRVARS
jgi:murein L,D-transpeptidase YafK